MRPLSRYAWIPLALSVSACCTHQLPKPNLTDFDCKPPSVCPVQAPGDVILRVNENGEPDQECVQVNPDENRVIWLGSDKIRLLEIYFKESPGRQTPRPPICAGALCSMAELKGARSPRGSSATRSLSRRRAASARASTRS